MASCGWTCRRVRCGTLNEARKRKCVGCGGPAPKKRVPAHRQALRDFSHKDYLALNERIHGVGDECAICGRTPTEGRKLDRDHDHTTGAPWSGQPRGLVCVSCNLLMPPKMTAERARGIAAYLEDVENFYEPDAPEVEAA